MQNRYGAKDSSNQPQTFNGDLAALPAALRSLTEHRRWVVWKWQKTKSGKWTKPPHRADDPCAKARSNDPATWSTYAAAVAAVKGGRADGIGYMMAQADGLPNGIGALDLDDCRDPSTGQIAPWAQELVDETASYVEATVSGTGLRIVGSAEGDYLDNSFPAPDGGEIELYRHATRFITISGLEIGNCSELQSIDELIERTHEKFAGRAAPRARARPRTSQRRVREKPISASLLALCDGHWRKGISTDKDDFPDFDLYVQAINLIPNPDLPWKQWKRIIMAIWAAFFGNADGLAAAHAFSCKSEKYDAAGTDQAWDEVTGSPPSGLSAGTLLYMADQASPGWRKAEFDISAEQWAAACETDAGQTEGPSTQADETVSPVEADSADAKADEPSADIEAPEQIDEANPGVEDDSADGPSATAKVDAWPTMGEAAYHGIIGEVVRTIEPETEADPVAILIQLIVATGNMMGREAYYQVESDRHHPNLFAAAVGETSKARKGTSWGRVRGICYHADQEWVLRHIGSGLSSGEGLIHQVRDRVTKINKDGEEEVVDTGVTDKRFMALEAELSSLLKVMERAGSTISPLFRKAWDGGDLQTLTRNSALRATAPHVSSIGHITVEELRSCLTRTDAANGFANRFLFFLVRRSKELPMGGNLDDKVIEGLGGRIGEAINHLMVGEEGLRIKFSPEGEARWREVYGRLTKGHPGLFGAITARGEAQVIRIALVYAIVDKSQVIDLPHIEAGLAVWDYCERSAKRIFGEMLGDNTADTILGGLKRVFPAGMSRSEIYRDLFGGNARASAIAAALVRLKDLGLAKVDVIKAAGVFGKPTEVWTYTPRRVST
jgi:hypothetical protein